MILNIFKKRPSISPLELEGLLKRNTLLIDVRTATEFKRGNVRFSQNLPLDRLDSFNPKHSIDNEPIYIICQSGARSSRASRMLQKQGYNAINVRGGMNQWTGPINGGKN